MNKRLRFSLLSMLVMLCGTVFADAYTVDFNSTIDTKNHAFKVAPGWGHIVDSSTYYDDDEWEDVTKYVSYSYLETDGKDATGALSAYQQKLATNAYYSTRDAYDLLVTPEVNGTVTLDIKASSSASYSYKGIV